MTMSAYERQFDKFAPYKMETGTARHYAALTNIDILEKQLSSPTLNTLPTTSTYTFCLNFYYDYKTLFSEILDSINIFGLGNDVITVILLFADFSYSYDTSFWINSPMIDNALKTKSINCKKQESGIQDDWYVNIVPYCYEKTSDVYPEIMYKVSLKLLKKPTRKIDYYFLTICGYMADKQSYRINTKQVEWSDNALMYGGKNWVPGYLYGSGKFPIPFWNDKTQQALDDAEASELDLMRINFEESWDTSELQSIASIFDNNIKSDDDILATILTNTAHVEEVDADPMDESESKDDADADGMYDDLGLNDIESMIARAQVAVNS